MAKIKTSINIPNDLANTIDQERKYYAKVDVLIDRECDSAFSDLVDVIEKEIKEVVPQGWGAETKGIGGLELDCYRAGAIESISKSETSDKVTLALGTVLSFGTALALIPLASRGKYLVPRKYHFIITDEHDNIKGLRSQYFSDEKVSPIINYM